MFPFVYNPTYGSLCHIFNSTLRYNIYLGISRGNNKPKRGISKCTKIRL